MTDVESSRNTLRARARGAVLGSAVGDALGAAYEFGTRAVGPDGPEMLGGGLGDFAPGEWTDDTTMAWAVLQAAADHDDLRSDAALTQVARAFRRWFESGPADIGHQTRVVLAEAGPAPTCAVLTATAADLHARTGRSAGNGSLMRTAPVALRYLDDPVGLVEAARRTSALTHHDLQAQDACALWSLAARHAIVEGELALRPGLGLLGEEAAATWGAIIDEAEQHEPDRFTPNGWVVTALQAAWSAIVHTPVPTDDPKHHLVAALDTAIRVGDDTDTVAAIAGGLLGARWGEEAVPERWRRMLHGYPGLTADDLLTLVDRVLD
ncbi:MAG: ADP-ribosylglycohydrolase family protein [Aeromicrobium erythreum]